MKKSLIILFVFVFISCKKEKIEQTPTQNIPPVNTSLFRVSGKDIIDSTGKKVWLKGVAFGNEIWSGVVPTMHHNELDFVRVKAMNMNVIRFYLAYDFFETDANPYNYKQTAWTWLDQNVAWAKKYGIGLILNMHKPQGGYQSQGAGDAFWTNSQNQKRLEELWKAIAIRYANEPTIVGYGLVNEPIPTSSVAQWSQIAQSLVDKIRQVDNHIIFIEKAISTKNSGSIDTNLNFPVVNDKNIVYEFHNYDPLTYTHQLFDWAGLGEGGMYPDENSVSYTNSSWYTGIFTNPKATSGTSDWTFYEGVKFKITDAKMKIGLPALVGANVGSTGKIYFDDFTIKEYDETGTFVKNVQTSGLETLANWGFWSSNNVGKSTLSVGGGRNGSNCIVLEGATADCNVSNYNTVFVPKQGYSYQISGWMKGENVPTTSNGVMRIDFLTTDQPVLGRNKTFLENSYKSYISWASNKNVPLYLGEIGAGFHCFKNNKGGIDFVSDMIEIVRTNGISFSYHAYHESSFGIYYDNGGLPSPTNANTELINLLTQKLK